MMLKQVQKLVTLLALWITLPIFIFITNPETIALPFLIVPFALLFVILYKTAKVLLSISARKLTYKRIRLMAAVIAALPTLLLILASIQQLTIRDGVIVAGLLLLLTFYMKRVDFNV